MFSDLLKDEKYEKVQWNMVTGSQQVAVKESCKFIELVDEKV